MVKYFKTLFIVLFAAVLFLIVRHEVNKRLSVYSVDAPEGAKFYEKYNYEDIVFDFANYYAQQVMEESDAERNAITEHLS